MDILRAAAVIGGLTLLIWGCASGPQPGVAGVYRTWDDVINRWIGAKKEDLYYELGPPNLHPHETKDGLIEMRWDMTIDRMPGQADYYNTLPLDRTDITDCQLVFFANPDGVIVSGRRIGCD